MCPNSLHVNYTSSLLSLFFLLGSWLVASSSIKGKSHLMERNLPRIILAIQVAFQVAMSCKIFLIQIDGLLALTEILE